MKLARCFVVIGAVFLSFRSGALLADTVVFGFDDGTFEGWELLDVFGEPLQEDSPVSWAPFDGVQDIGDGFDLLPATSGEFRVVPSPWSNRDCIGVGDCYTQILRSPQFLLDDSGDIQIDMMGGGAVSNRPLDDVNDFLPDSADDLTEFKDSACCQGFALRDVNSGDYVLQAFSTGENDGKARATDPPSRAVWETVSISKEDLASFANNGQPYEIDIYDSYQGGWGWIGFDTVRIPGTVASGVQLEAGDADQDFDFDQLDLVRVQVAAKYLTGQTATWGEGDWNSAPGGSQGNPPEGDGQFNQLDIISSLNAGKYLTGPYGALDPEPGDPNDDQTSLFYNAPTGELSVNTPVGVELTSINITSDARRFVGGKPGNLDGAFDNFDEGNIFKATFGGSFGAIGFGPVLPAGLSRDEVLVDLTAVGSLAGGGDLGNIDLIYVPEPASLILLLGGSLVSILTTVRRRINQPSVIHQLCRSSVLKV